jgi:Protein of unknown function (DUF3179)
MRHALAAIVILAPLAPATASLRAQGAPLAATAARVDRHPILEAGPGLPADRAPLKDTDLVVGVAVGRQARAYPLSVLWEEDAHTVDDQIGGVPVAVAACPLAGVGTAFDRRVGKEVLELGHLVATRWGSLILYDAGSGSEWSLLTGEAFDGPKRGERLTRLPTLFTTWRRWRSLHPGTTVYRAPETSAGGLDLNAERLQRIIFAGEGPPSRQDWVVGIEGPSSTAAVLVRALANRRVANAELDQVPIAVFTTEDLTTTVVWRRAVRERVLTFTAVGDRMRDAETGTEWDPLTGRASRGPLAGRTLAPMSSVTGFWHAWQAQHPRTVVLDVGGD